MAGTYFPAVPPNVHGSVTQHEPQAGTDIWQHAGGATFISTPFSTELVHNHLRELLPDGRKPEPLKEVI